MKNLAGKVALLTGASGGLGIHIARALANEGVKLALVASPGMGLEELRNSILAKKVEAISSVSDLRELDQIHAVFELVLRHFGRIDILINNAGVEFTAALHTLTEENVRDVVRINLEAPLLLTRLVLPQMLERRAGHVVNISSLAGKSGPAFQEPYAASKAGLIAFTSSLRATYRPQGVSASVICPGFVEAGIYARLKTRSGCAAPALLGTSPPERVGESVVRCIRKDLPEAVINPYPVRPLFAMAALFPRLGEWLIRQTGAHDFFRKAEGALRAKEAQAGQSLALKTDVGQNSQDEQDCGKGACHSRLD